MQSFLLHKPTLIVFAFIAHLLVSQAQAQPSFTFEQALRLLPKSKAWLAADQGYLTAERSVNIARGAAGLNISVGADASRSQVSSSEPTLNGTALNISVNVQASLAILPWSPAFDAVRNAERNLERSRIDLLEQRSQLQLSLLNQYLQVQIQSQDTLLAAQNVGFAKLRLQTLQAQLKARTTTKEAVLSAEAALKSAEANARVVGNAKSLALRGFFSLLSIPVQDTIFSSEMAVPKLELSEAELNKQIQQARASRPDLRRAMIAVREAEDNLAIATRDRWLPNVGLNANISGVSADGRPTGTQIGTNLNLATGTLGVNGAYSPNTSAATSTTISVQITIPILAPSNDARIETAEAALNAAKLNLEQLENNAVLDIQNRYDELQIAILQQDIANANLEVAKQRETDTQARLTAGLTNTLDLEQAKLQLNQATREVQNAKNQTVLANNRFLTSIRPLELPKTP
jgi:outer membrane protein